MSRYRLTLYACQDPIVITFSLLFLPLVCYIHVFFLTSLPLLYERNEAVASLRKFFRITGRYSYNE